MSYQPKPGHFLHASCSDADVFEIVGAGVDDNGTQTIDVRVLDIDEILHFEDDKEAKGDGSDNKWSDPLTRGELPPGVNLVLRGMQWRSTTPGHDGVERIVVNAPEGGCYRCCYLFSVHASAGGRDPVKAP